eukprot:TRINITY_DN55852_c0_g1_i1.p2 TRINITY_DN55852_c0_g1~~TRINITY_DN55852_c0_g1_i1.p2  ORF type:complete len:142 (+),score=41.98 TRINITY_DN55852_c0_g1_i1:78-503(+)
MVKRKRRNKKADLNNIKVSLSRNRGRLVATPQMELKKTTKELEEEVQKLKELKSEMRRAKARRARQPKPIDERKALDHQPVIAGHRVDKRTRVQRAQERQARKLAAEERRERLRKKKEERGAQEVDFGEALGADFFSSGAD